MIPLSCRSNLAGRPLKNVSVLEAYFPTNILVRFIVTYLLKISNNMFFPINNSVILFTDLSAYTSTSSHEERAFWSISLPTPLPPQKICIPYEKKIGGKRICLLICPMFSISVLCGNQKKITNAFAFRKIRFCIQLAMHEGLSIATWNKGQLTGVFYPMHAAWTN